jgi:hypothetical protein
MLLLFSPLAHAQKVPNPVEIEFFEKNVRPILAESCYGCHGSVQQLGGLRLDTAAMMAKGGPRGPVVIAGSPEKSLLLRAIHYTDSSLRMPPSGRLKADQIALLENWVQRGAAMPITKNASVAVAKPTDLLARRSYWAYQLPKRVKPPIISNASNPIDGFIRATLAKNQLKPAAAADKRVLLRRLSFDLIGLPPTVSETQGFLSDASPNAYEKQIDRLLASPHYGERWGRHWLDLVRYSETLGHEFDFAIFNAYQYRDYVIRALNSDVPYDQFVKEHLAGDLLPSPRVDKTTGINESVIGTGFLWLGDNTHSPVDLTQDQADRIDRQIDVIGKTFLGQTLACARCHNHKFDPIPTKDYYGLYGILQSSYYQQTVLDPGGKRLAAARAADQWRQTLPKKALAAAVLAALPTDDKILSAAVPKTLPSTENSALPLSDWQASGTAFGPLGQPGDLLFSGKTAQLLETTTATSALRPSKLEGVLRSPSFVIERPFLHWRVSGHRSRVNLVIDNFLVIRDPLYGFCSHEQDNSKPHWETIDLTAYKNQRACIELIDSPLTNLSVDPPRDANDAIDGEISLESIVFSEDRRPPGEQPNPLATLSASGLREALADTLTRWGESQPLTKATDRAALQILNQFLLKMPLAEASAQFAALSDTIPALIRVVTTGDGGNAVDGRVFVRGNYRTIGEAAPRLQLAACFTERKALRAAGNGSGRLELAGLIASSTHPLTARVMVNRLWKQHFGRGLVNSPDDFGHMGELPTHPELLDYLATEFVKNGWSLKKMHKLMLLSQTYQQSSIALDQATETKDPENKLLHRANVRRLEAEAIRDAMLCVSGRLSPTLYGPSVAQVYNEFSEGRGRSASGPLDGDGRRTIYLEIRRNFLSPFLLAFDFPIPFTTMGKRSISNVPAQALALMNGAFVQQQASVWAASSEKNGPDLTTTQRVISLYETAFSRPPTATELRAAEAFLIASDKPDWAAFCHVLFNIKEFVFVR